MSESAKKTFDCVEMMRKIRDDLSEQLAHLETFEDRLKWLRTFQHTDPLLQMVQRMAAEQTHAADGRRKTA